MSFFRRLRDYGLSALLLVLPFFVLRANLKDPSKTTMVDRWLLQLSAPVQWVAVQLARGTSAVVEDYVYLVEVNKENERLEYENRRLHQQLERLFTLERENERLSDLLVLREQVGGEQISGRVIAKDISPQFHVIRVRLDRGADDRVQNGMAVVTPEGLVGQVVRTEARYCDVMLTVDEGSAVDVVVSRTGSRGILRGTGEAEGYKSRIQYLLRADEVREGDAVYTSGLGRRFPPNIKVGTISKIERRDFGLYQVVEVEPAVRFGRLEEVLILTQGAREQDPRQTDSRESRARGH